MEEITDSLSRMRAELAVQNSRTLLRLDGVLALVLQLRQYFGLVHVSQDEINYPKRWDEMLFSSYRGVTTSKQTS